MRKFFLLASCASALVYSACQCGSSKGMCEAICTTGTHCDGATGFCVNDNIAAGGGVQSAGGGTSATGGGNAATGGGVSTGGGSATGGGTGTGGGAPDGGPMGNCTPACSGNTPVCDPQSNLCVTCNAQSGCFGSTPFCDTSQLHGQCVGCRGQADCTTANTYCDQLTHTCQLYQGTGGGGGATGGGTGTGGGYNNTVIFDDAGMTANCLGGAGGGGQGCTNECNRGFTCVNGQCILNGANGPIQVTLRFPNEPEDLDLHVVEPVNNTTCEIFYEQPNVDAGIFNPFQTFCGAYGWLDLDSNPACNLDNVDIENVIYSPGNPVHTGQYTVRVDYYQNCSATGAVPFEVEVRALGQTRYYCGSFQPSDSDSGGANAGRTITTFDIQ